MGRSFVPGWFVYILVKVPGWILFHGSGLPCLSQVTSATCGVSNKPEESQGRTQANRRDGRGGSGLSTSEAGSAKVLARLSYISQLLRSLGSVVGDWKACQPGPQAEA